MAPGAAASPYNPVAQGRAAASDLPPTSRPQDDPALAAARRRRAELLQSIHLFERALAVPAGDPNWHELVTERLAGLREAVTEHVVVTEGPDGLYKELLDHAPRLCRGVDILIREHAALVDAADALCVRLEEPAVAVEQVRGWASDLLRELSRHRQRGADLVYEAYATDIGGET
jgi:hypothetical protein